MRNIGHKKNKIILFTEIANLLKERGLFYKKFKFTCYFDNLFNFELNSKGTRYSLSIICDNDILNNESFMDIANFRGMFFFSFDIHETGKETIKYLWRNGDDKSEIINDAKKIKETKKK